jgi:hypothetical protein
MSVSILKEEEEGGVGVGGVGLVGVVGPSPPQPHRRPTNEKNNVGRTTYLISKEKRITTG